MKLRDRTEQSLGDRHLVVVEWGLPWAHPERSPYNTGVFLFDTRESSCTVFVVAGPAVAERIAKAIVMAFEGLDSPDEASLPAFAA